ncbi:NAD-P-binding protein [Vararia minispora EC-137]|uniref:NAD-P-binding protein n=1 Tax=Vararia minispora EC-137 TaxID=1314806 RepID=A0ACB8QDJ1_9AGAM|nr:NAD-P-binding protein [Vararia minispora EC-137]
MSTNTAWILPCPGSGISAVKRVSGPRPLPQPHQYLVRVHAVSLNYRDVAVVDGSYPTDVKENVVMGADLAGEIVEAGKAARRFAVGARVTTSVFQEFYYGLPPNAIASLGSSVDGTLQEYRVFDEMELLPTPAHLSYEELACLPGAGVTAWNVLFGGGWPLRPGQTVLVQGTGGVSVFVLQIAHAVGAKTIVTSSSDEKLELAKKFGATHVINYKKTPDWDKEAKRLTNGIGAHIVVDNVGIEEIERCFGAVARGGTIANVGFLGKAEPSKAVNTPRLALVSGSQMRGILLGSKQQFEELLNFVDVHKIRPHVHKVFEFDQVPEALEYLMGGQHFGKVVVRVASK